MINGEWLMMNESQKMSEPIGTVGDCFLLKEIIVHMKP